MQFDADQHVNEFEPIEGQHPFRINTVTNAMTQGGDPMLVVEMQITEGKYRNRRHTDRFLLEHSNPETVRIAMGKLSSLSRCVGRPKWNDERDLENCFGEAVFGPQKSNPEFGEIKRYIVPAETKGAAASNPHRDVRVPTYGGAASVPANRQPAASLPNGRPVAPDFDDSDVPF